MPTINRHEFFDSLREFFDQKGVNETRIYPDHVEVFRFEFDESGAIRHDDNGDAIRTQEIYWLTSGPSLRYAVSTLV